LKNGQAAASLNFASFHRAIQVSIPRSIHRSGTLPARARWPFSSGDKSVELARPALIGSQQIGVYSSKFKVECSTFSERFKE